MGIRKRPSKRAKNGYVYEIFFQYKDEYGCSTRYTKSGFLSKKEAREYEALKMAELLERNEFLKDKDKTFNDVFLEYMDVEGGKYSRSTKQYYEKSYHLYVKDSIGRYIIRNLKYKHLQKYFNGLDAGYSTLRNIKKLMSVTFAYAQKNNYIRENPMKLVTIEKEEETDEKKKIITKEELDIIIDNILITHKMCPQKDYTDWNNYAFAVAIYIGWYTGLRLSETFGLMKEDFDFENNEINIRRRLEYHALAKDDLYVTDKLKTKAAKSTIPLAPKLKEGLEKWFSVNPYDNVICDINGKWIHPHTIIARIRYVSFKTRIEFHYHMLRHSFTSRLIKHGILPAVAKELVRHADIKTILNIYTHIEKEDKEKAIFDVFDD